MSKSQVKRSSTRSQYRKCAEVAHEFNELIALGELGPLLEAEGDHAYLCNLGVWYWQCGHRMLASACYRRSLELHPEAPTYLNLAVCLDDMASVLVGDSESIIRVREGYSTEAVGALKSFYTLVATAEERSSVEAMLRQKGKSHLVEAAA